MGIESDQLVYDYLSRVGDLAQQAQLPSGQRMRLVTELRGEIEKQRGRLGGSSPAGVRRILGRLGTPHEVVAAAASGGPGVAAPPEAPQGGPVPAVPEAAPAAAAAGTEPTDAPEGSPERSGPRARLRLPRPRTREAPGPPAASPPHLAGTDELGTTGSEPDWWRVGAAPSAADPFDAGPFGAGARVPGFVGGVEVPEILRPPRGEQDEDQDEDGAGGEGDAPDAPRAGRRLLPRLLRRGAAAAPAAEAPAEGAPAGGRVLGSPLLLLAAVLLVAGAVAGSLIALGAGWLIAYGSRRLTPGQSKAAVLYLPGAAAAAGLVWLWGRLDGRWGAAVPEGGMGEALSGTWPWVLKGAALASALFLLWRARAAR
ncbi:hypothetical protein [Streptomyces sp. NPDC055929]|uniref:hypothetical protein n=1 Tax=Streptomyces sp. NPDC055929 TaxID=3345662 RepID=UPI0035DF37A1